MHVHTGIGDSGADVSADLAALGSVAWADACAAQSDTRDDLPADRSNDDLYVLYTGGTTGMPKGVMWRQEDVYFALGQGIDAVTGERVSSEYTMSEKAAAAGGGLTFLVIPPMMHGAAQWGTMGQMLQGNTIVLLPKFSGEAVWELIEKEKVNSALITGDAMGRPMIEHLEANPDRYDTSSLISVSSSAAIFSPDRQGPLPRVLPEPHHHRLDRVVGVGVQRAAHGREGPGPERQRRADRVARARHGAAGRGPQDHVP